MIAPEVPGRERMIRRILTWLTVGFGVAGLGWGAWESLWAHPSLDRAIRLADEGKLDDAAAAVRAYLAADPAAPAAHLLLAQIILKNSDPSSSTQARSKESESAQLALDHLRKIHPTNARMAVTLQLCRGNALNRLLRFDEAEAAWLEALNLDLTAPEAGWHLLHLYYLQGREEEARRLALRLFAAEPDPHDRVLLLLELVKTDARPPAPGSLVKLFEPVVRQHPGEYHSALALGLALTRASQVDEGIDQLRRVVQADPGRDEAWDYLLTALDESGQVDLLEEELERAPAALTEAPRLLKHKARIAQGRGRWKEAVDLYRRAQAAEPYNRVVEYRLSRALRHVGQTAEADRIEQRLRSRDIAIQEIRPLYDQATEIPGLGIRPQPQLYQRIAEARERMQLPDEARAWHQLVLRSDPHNEVSRAALKRLGEPREPG
jgi:tetratricopeptide (TPR) repeat protein